MLYLPYIVLQELDKLKMRSGVQEGVKTLAVRAIKYLNEKFEQNSPHIKGTYKRTYKNDQNLLILCSFFCSTISFG